MEFNLSKYIRPSLISLAPYQSARQEFEGDGRKMILLDANENPFESVVNRYPDPLQQQLKKENTVRGFLLGALISQKPTSEPSILFLAILTISPTPPASAKPKSIYSAFSS